MLMPSMREDGDILKGIEFMYDVLLHVKHCMINIHGSLYTGKHLQELLKCLKRN